MTRRLYYENMYESDFQATVAAVDGNKVVLDQTLFFPEGGGQAGDTGKIGSLSIVDTQKRGGREIQIEGTTAIVDAEILHILEVPAPFEEGQKVVCSVDWERRHRVMRLHSATHIMEHFLLQVFGELPRLGSSVTPDKCKDTYASEERLDNERLAEVADLCNSFIRTDQAIELSSHPDAADFRYWKCGEISIACGGTHPRTVGEVGAIRLKRFNPGAGKEGIETRLVDPGA